MNICRRRLIKSMAMVVGVPPLQWISVPTRPEQTGYNISSFVYESHLGSALDNAYSNDFATETSKVNVSSDDIIHSIYNVIIPLCHSNQFVLGLTSVELSFCIQQVARDFDIRFETLKTIRDSRIGNYTWWTSQLKLELI